MFTIELKTLTLTWNFEEVFRPTTVFVYLVEINPAHITSKRFDVFRMNKYKELQAIFDLYMYRNISTLFK